MPRWLPRVLAQVREHAILGRVVFTEKARREREALELVIEAEDAQLLLLELTAADCSGRVFSPKSAEWMYVFKPAVLATRLYVKLMLRADCVVVSFHEDRVHRDGEEDA